MIFFSCVSLCSPYVSTLTKCISFRQNYGANYISDMNSYFAAKNDQAFKSFSAIIIKPYQVFAGCVAGVL